jgi:NADPH2:quinone reductase
MRRVVCREFSDTGPWAEDAAEPEPGPGQVVIGVRAAAVSFVDGLLVRGRYQVRPPLPYVPGSVAAGEIVAAGPGTRAPAVGSRVVAMTSGCWADQVVAHAAACVPLPDETPFDVAAAAIEGYATARFALEHRTRVEPGEWVVVLGAGGGVGSAVVDVARSLGARVVAVASTAAKRDVALAAGADAVLDPAADDVKARVREITGGGADVVVDPVGGELAEVTLRALRRHGRYLVVGFASGDIPRLPANHVLLTNRTVVGVDWGDHVRHRPADALPMIGGLVRDIAAGALRPPTPASYPLDKAAEALAELASRRVAGKLVLVP